MNKMLLIVIMGLGVFGIANTALAVQPSAGVVNIEKSPDSFHAGRWCIEDPKLNSIRCPDDSDFPDWN